VIDFTGGEVAIILIGFCVVGWACYQEGRAWAKIEIEDLKQRLEENNGVEKL